MIDLIFPVVGTQLPTDHAYPLYAALSRCLPCLHDGSVPFALGPISGIPTSRGQLQIDTCQSRLLIRVEDTHLRQVLPLAGRGLQVMQWRLQLGAPHVQLLRPVSAVYARTVAIKNAIDAASFRAAARRDLDALGIGGELVVPDHVMRDGRVEPHRHVMRIKQVKIVCFSAVVKGLTADESLKLQEVGLGGRRRMGGGVFVPVGDREGQR